jgi:molybdate transport system substrate-binding protein
MGRNVVVIGIVIAALFIGVCHAKEAEKQLIAFCGAASKPAMEEAARAFKESTGIQVDLQFGGSGTMLSQMKMARRGDLYIPGSPDYMVKAEREGLVDGRTIKIIAYLLPAIGVQPGNPKNIRTLKDLAKPGLKVGIGNPEAVCVGLYALEILDGQGLLEQVEKNIVTHAPSCAATESLVVMKKVDAVLGWDVFSKWNPGRIETIFLKTEEIPRIAYIPAAVSIYSRDRKGSSEFISFLATPEGQKIFAKWGYVTSEKEARRFAPGAKMGGEYMLPSKYKGK